MKYFYLIANPLKKGTRQKRQEIVAYLESHGAVCCWSQMLEDHPYGAYSLAESVPKDTQCVITLGGDGTLIRAARNLVRRKIPLLGINMGTLGYLTQVSGGEAFVPMLDALLKDNYQLEHRMMLEGRVICADGREELDMDVVEGIALNEIVLTRSGGLQPIHFQLYVNGQYLNEYTADGMIVATPTGSTAYNLSAGGPIVTPCAELIVLTPICSHALNSSSIVLAGTDTVEILVADDPENQGQMAVFDGDTTAGLDCTRRLQIKKSVCQTTFIRLKDVSFLDALRDKMAKV